MSFGAPDPPNPTTTAGTQQQYNTEAARTQQQVNSYNQSNPYGNLNYLPDASSPSGYRINTQLSVPQQGLLETQQANQGTAGGTAGTLLKTAGTLANNTAGMYGSAPNIQALDPTNLVKTLNNWSATYQQPIFDQQDSNLEAQLRSQGLTPGSEAYNNAKNLLARNQGDQTKQFLTANIGQGQAAQAQKFGQDVTNYQLPLQTEAALTSAAAGPAGYAAPNGGMWQQGPTAQIQPPNYQGAVQNNYEGQVKNYGDMWNNVSKLGTAAIGLAGAPFTGGLSLGAAGALGGMFGGSGVPGVSNAQVMSQPNPYGSMQQIGGGWG